MRATSWATQGVMAAKANNPEQKTENRMPNPWGDDISGLRAIVKLAERLSRHLSLKITELMPR
jgi:hypothetical protein